MRIPSWNVYQWKMPGAISCMARHTNAANRDRAPTCSGRFRLVLIRRGPGTLLCTLGAVLAGAGAAMAAPPPAGSKWTQQYIDEPDGTQLHADVLRPAGLPDDAKTPVILSIGPYFNHSGQLGAIGGVEGEPFDPITV